jgi:hypothetical protein
MRRVAAAVLAILGCAHAEPEPTKPQTPEQRELAALWREWGDCGIAFNAVQQLQVQACEQDIMRQIDAAKARHLLAKQSHLDREQQERHHQDVMSAIQPPPSPQPIVDPTIAVANADAVRAERLRRATSDAKSASPWSCFVGSIASQPTGWCTTTPESCSAEAQGFAKMQGATLSQECKPQPLAACVSATSVLQSKQQHDCFAAFVGCEAYRAHLLRGSDFTGVTECEPTPTSWVSQGAPASPF